MIHGDISAGVVLFTNHSFEKTNPPGEQTVLNHSLKTFVCLTLQVSVAESDSWIRSL